MNTNLDLASQTLANSQVTFNSYVSVTGDTFVVALNSAAQPSTSVPLHFTQVQDFENKNMRSRLLQIKVDGCPPFNFPKLSLKAKRMSNG